MLNIVIHAGFHKTGTKSVQTALAENRSRLAPDVLVYLRDDILPLTTAARACSVKPSIERVEAFGAEAMTFFGAIPRGEAAHVILSCEDLLGVMPGRRGVETYAAAPSLMAALEAVFDEVFADQARLSFYFSTRAAGPWLNSLWWQNLRSTRITLDSETYAKQAAPAARLDACVEEIRGNLSGAKVFSQAMEDTKDLPQGVLTPILDLIDCPDTTRAQLVLGGPQNSRPKQGLEPVFLELNRSGLSDDIVSKTKRQLLRAARSAS